MRPNESSNKKTKIVLNSDLQSFFFKKLNEINDHIPSPITQELLFYSSSVLEKFAKCSSFFDIEDGKFKEKVLGLKLLQTHQMEKEKKVRELKDIGETAVIVCGYFPQGKSSKIVNTDYYKRIGRVAYEQLDTFQPEFLDVPSFYQICALNFGNIVNLINILASKMNSNIDVYEKYAILQNQKESLKKEN